MSNRESGKLGGLVSSLKKEQRIQIYNQSPAKCSFCDGKLPYKKRKNIYCGRNCSNKGRKKDNPLCAFCKTNNVNFKQAKFCSMQCYHAYKWKKRKIEFEKSGLLICDYTIAKRYLAEKRGGYRCEICKNTLWNGKPIGLTVDHIDGNPYNEKILNKRLICNNCDEQLPTYKARNRGKGRKSRRKKLKPKVSTKQPTYCVDCSKEISKNSIRCRNCHDAYKTDWPPIEEIIKMVNETSINAVSKKIGVSFNGLKKKLKKLTK
jgi:hypothetical protein